MAKRILFIEDDFSLGKMYSEALANHGYEVDLEPSSEAAQKRLESQKYDLILLDLLLPGLPGIDFLRLIKAENSPHRNTPVYILTNVDSDGTIADGVSLGIQGYFLKVDTTPKKILATLNGFFKRYN